MASKFQVIDGQLPWGLPEDGVMSTKLEPMNLTVVGGRDTQIGVGGFILGDE